MNTSESQFPTSHVKVIHNAQEERGWEPAEREDRLGTKVNAFDNTDMQHAKRDSQQKHTASYVTNEARAKGTLPTVKIRSN